MLPCTAAHRIMTSVAKRVHEVCAISVGGGGRSVCERKQLTQTGQYSGLRLVNQAARHLMGIHQKFGCCRLPRQRRLACE